jgi:hypothetical protein
VASKAKPISPEQIDVPLVRLEVSPTAGRRRRGCRRKVARGARPLPIEAQAPWADGIPDPTAHNDGFGTAGMTACPVRVCTVATYE